MNGITRFIQATNTSCKCYYFTLPNNGRITGSTTITGESVTYAYDSLNRLITATSAGQWGLEFSYDGFGNRLSQDLQTGTWQGYVPTIHQSYDMRTNRLLGQTYDDNGNMLGLSYDPATFDVENRMVAYKTDSYDYAADNKRIYKKTPGTSPIEEVYFYAGGRKIATYKVEYGYLDQDNNLAVAFVEPKQHLLRRQADRRQRSGRGTRPPGLGRRPQQQRSVGEAFLLPLRRRADLRRPAHCQQPRQVRHVLPGHEYGVGLCGPAVLLQPVRTICDQRPISGQRWGR